MRLTTAIAAIDFLFDTSRSNHLSITYFGGEPALNSSVMIESARHARERAEREKKQLSLHVVTNGVAVDETLINALAELDFSFTISIDGPPEYHNEIRPAKNGSDSYAATVESLEIAMRRRLANKITLRGTYVRQSAYFYPYLKHLVECGYTRNFSYEPVFLPEENPLSLRKQELPEIERAYQDVAQYYVAAIRSGEAFCLWDIDEAITKLLSHEHPRFRCGSGNSLIAVTSRGELYGCHMSTGMEKALLGTLDNGFSADKRGPWRNVHSGGREGCRGCWIERVCAYGCNTHALVFNDDIHKPFELECEIIDIFYRAAMWIISELPELFGNLHALYQRSEIQGHVTSPLWALIEKETKRKASKIVLADLPHS
jgi:uncharacterized protein